MKWKAIVLVAVLAGVVLPTLKALTDWCGAAPVAAQFVEGEARAGKGICKMPPNVAAKCDDIARATEWACSDEGMATSDADRRCRNLGARDARCRRCSVAPYDSLAVAAPMGDVPVKGACERAREDVARLCVPPQTDERRRACERAQASEREVCLPRGLDALAQLVGAMLGEGEAHAFARVPKCDNSKPPVPMCYDLDCPWTDPVAHAACCKLNTRWECPATPPALTVDDCRRAREKCKSSMCGAAMQERQFTPCPDDPKCRCEAACERASKPECCDLLSK